MGAASADRRNSALTRAGASRMSDRDGTIWYDGEMVPWRMAQVHALNYTLHYGMGVFEGVRAYQTENRGTCVFRLEDHTRRLLNSARILDIDVPWSAEALNDAQLRVVRENGLESAYIRPVCFYSADDMGLRAEPLHPHVAIAAWSWPAYMEPEAAKHGIAVCTSSHTRHHVNIAMCKAKANGQYINSIMALREARANGCEEALMLDNEGYVAEGSGENVFIVRRGALHTPELSSCLEGITRETILQLAQDMGIEVAERRITRDEVYIADEAFFTGTAAEVLPIHTLDRRRIGNGGCGPLTRMLQQAYFEEVRGTGRHDAWLAPVSLPSAVAAT